MADFFDSALLSDAKTHLCGATWPNDSTPQAAELRKKSTVVLLETEGCGAVTHFHASNYLVNGDPYGSSWFNPIVKGLILRVFYDRCATAAIEMPLMDFFADVEYDSDFFSTLYFSKVKYSHNCRLVMPFRKHIRIEVENPTDSDMTGYAEIQWETVDKLPDNCGYLHVDYRQGKIHLPQNLLEVCDIKGRGSIVAHWLQVGSDHPSCKHGESICEGNHNFFLDGESVPSMVSQGSEDYYNYSWGFQETSAEYAAAILKRKLHESGGSTVAMLRCRDKDSIRFSKSCRGVIDYTQEYFSPLSVNPRHKKSNCFEFDADYKSCYYYYQ